jgi:hypothetical protein
MDVKAGRLLNVALCLSPSPPPAAAAAGRVLRALRPPPLFNSHTHTQKKQKKQSRPKIPPRRHHSPPLSLKTHYSHILPTLDTPPLPSLTHTKKNTSHLITRAP